MGKGRWRLITTGGLKKEGEKIDLVIPYNFYVTVEDIMHSTETG
jgi:hypothetical protein